MQLNLTPDPTLCPKQINSDNFCSYKQFPRLFIDHNNNNSKGIWSVTPLGELTFVGDNAKGAKNQGRPGVAWYVWSGSGERKDLEVIFKEDLTWDISIKFHCKHWLFKILIMRLKANNRIRNHCAWHLIQTCNLSLKCFTTAKFQTFHKISKNNV